MEPNMGLEHGSTFTSHNGIDDCLVDAATPGRGATLRRLARSVPTLLGAAAVAAALVAAPASANTTGVIFVEPDIAGMELMDFDPGADLSVTITRGGVTVATARGKADATGALNLNNLGPIGDGEACFTGFTPDMLPGDVVTVDDGDPTTLHRTTIQNLTVQAATIVGNDIVVHGTASDPAGNPVPPGDLNTVVVGTGEFHNGKKRLDAAKVGTIRYPDGEPTGMTTTFAGYGLDAAKPALAINSWVDAAGNGTAAQFPPLRAAVAGCPTLAGNAVTGVDGAHTVNGRPQINLANVGQDLVVEGVSQPDVSSVSVTVGDGIASTAPVSATSVKGSWTATIPAAEIARLADGPLTASGTYALADGDVSGRTLTVDKGTGRPVAPAASVPGGIYRSDLVVRLNAGQGATIRYTTDGSDPALSPTAATYSGPIPVTAVPGQVTTTTVRAMAVDAAGNPSLEASAFSYTIDPVAPPQPVASVAPGRYPAAQSVALSVRDATPGGTSIYYTADGTLPDAGSTPYPPGSAIAVTRSTTLTAIAIDAAGNASAPTALAYEIVPPAHGPGAPAGRSSARPTLRPASVTVARTQSLRLLRRKGLAVQVNVRAGTKIVRLRLVARGKPVVTTYRTIRRAGRVRLTIPARALRRLPTGRYALEVSAGRSRRTLGPATRRTVRIGR
jgi:hypothetical protein